MHDLRRHRQAATQAIRALRGQVRWRTGKDAQHLAKRKSMGHLLPQATVEDYNRLIQALASDVTSMVYHYPFGWSLPLLRVLV